jgi:hypothetical protein
MVLGVCESRSALGDARQDALQADTADFDDVLLCIPTATHDVHNGGPLHMLMLHNAVTDGGPLHSPQLWSAA